MDTNRICWFMVIGAVFLPRLAFCDDSQPADVAEAPPFDEFLVIPLRVHVLTAVDLPDVDCRLTDADVKRILGKVNGIWHKAGVHWGLESLRREPAAHQDRFRLARDLDSPRQLGLFSLLVPEASRTFDGLHVYYIHRFSVNGVWLGEDFAIVQETAKLREVEGGIDEPVPRVTAHELGHMLGLSHRQARTNLLASGTTGTSLNAEEVSRARRVASRQRGAASVRELKNRADVAERRGEIETARRIWGWLAELPGDGAAEARERRDSQENARSEPPERPKR